MGESLELKQYLYNEMKKGLTEQSDSEVAALQDDNPSIDDAYPVEDIFHTDTYVIDEETDATRIIDYMVDTLADDLAESLRDKTHSIDDDDDGDNYSILSDSVHLPNPPIQGGNPAPSTIEDFPRETGDLDGRLYNDDMITILHAEHQRNTFSGDHIRSMNTFMSEGLKTIITRQFEAKKNNIINLRDRTEEDKSISHYNASVVFTEVNLRHPTTTKYKSADVQIMTPSMARLQDATYSAPLEVSAEIKISAVKKNGTVIEKTGSIKDFRISSIPVMVKSYICNTHGLPDASLKELQEDPRDPGGVFIIGGSEWVINSLENIANNKFHVYKKAFQDEIARGNFISKPGDSYENSRQIILRYLTNGSITIEMTTGKLHGIQLPFYLIFRLMGINSDKEIVNQIVYGVNNTDIISKQMYKILETAFQAEDVRFSDLRNSLDVNQITYRIAHTLYENSINKNYKSNANSVRYFNTQLERMVDDSLLPHIGRDAMTRHRKAMYVGHLIHTMLRVSLQVIESTDRDSFANKRLTAAGVSLSKAFKTHFNIVVIQELKNAFTQAFKSTQFSSINPADVFRSAIKVQDLERLLMQSIKSGNKIIIVKRNEIPNRVSSQLYEHKNDVNTKAQLGSIVTPSSSSNKQNERADVMRRVHPTYAGYICTSQSADGGEKVGVNKQKAISASISESTDSYMLKKILVREPTMISLDDIRPEDIQQMELAKVFVNGDWIGCVKESHKLAHLYRLKRRFNDGVNHHVSIIWEPMVREIHFWTDVGRLIRPLLIVYNNSDEYNDWVRSGRKGKPVEFRQWIKLTRRHILGIQRGTTSIVDLRHERVLEYISAEEQLNCYLSMDLKTLREHANDIMHPFTHCDIPQSVFGLPALTSPYINHSSGVRVTYHTNQKKQTAGWFTLNWPYMVSKGVFLQYYCDRPIVQTYADTLTNPNCQNLMIALQCYSGYNQEDSTIGNASSVDRGMYNGSKFRVEKTELEQNEEFGNPDFTRTIDVKKNAIYDCIENGVVKKGTIVHNGHVLIVKTARIPKPVDDNLYIDKSIVYQGKEPAYVENVILPRSEEGVLSAKVELRIFRPISKGGKVSSRTGNKGIMGKMLRQEDMPYAEDGTVPDIIVNPHSIPSRMAIGQIFETLSSTIGVKLGKMVDSTCFKEIDIYEMIEQLEKLGGQYGGKKRLYNGMTGNWIDTHIVLCINAYQMLLKFIDDDSYYVNHGPTNALTHQPVDGKVNKGGLRLGEMEQWVIGSHGAMRFLHQKLYDHSDGINIPICMNCGNKAIVNTKKGMYRCKYCEDQARIANVPSSWVCNIFTHVLSGMGIKTDFELESPAFPQIQDKADRVIE